MVGHLTQKFPSVGSQGAKFFLLHFRILERILRGSFKGVEKNFGRRGNNLHAVRHVPVTVSPQPYDIIQRTI